MIELIGCQDHWMRDGACWHLPQTFGMNTNLQRKVNSKMFDPKEELGHFTTMKTKEVFNGAKGMDWGRIHFFLLISLLLL